MLEQCGNGGTDTAKGKARNTRTLKAAGITKEMAETVDNATLKTALKARGLPDDVIKEALRRKIDEGTDDGSPDFQANRKAAATQAEKKAVDPIPEAAPPPTKSKLKPLATDRSNPGVWSDNSGKQWTDSQILSKISDIDAEGGHDNYTPIYKLREQMNMPRQDFDNMMYSLLRQDKVQLSYLQEGAYYTKEQFNDGLKQNFGNPLFFIIRN